MCGSGSESRKLLNTDPIRIRSLIHNTGYHKSRGVGRQKAKETINKTKKKGGKEKGNKKAWLHGCWCSKMGDRILLSF